VTKPAPRLSIRLDFARGRLGPGKVELLEHVGRERSLAEAARAMQMSYKRAWELLSTLNDMFDAPVAVTHPGRNQEGSTELTPFGERVVALYRAIERRTAQASSAAVDELSAASRPAPAAARTAAAPTHRSKPATQRRRA
jgi:molybdate transport system regulatory protein